MPDCAYCGTTDHQITREHIWPRCVLDRAKHDLRYSGKARKLVRADLTVKDVCESCNNGVLSELDEYFCSLYDKYFGHEVKEDEAILFSYDFGLLARALLKIAFNSARTTGIDIDALNSYGPVVITRGAVPIGVYIKVATISSYERIDRSGHLKHLPARAARCGPIAVLDRNSDGLTARIVQLEGYRFYVVITERVENKAAAVRYLANEGGTWLSRSGETLISRPSMTALEAFQGIQNWRKER